MVEAEVMSSALQDMKNIIGYVHTQSVQNAEKLYNGIKERIASLQQFPERGSIVEEVTGRQLREIRLYLFRICFPVDDDKVQVLTIHHSARLLINNPHLNNLF